MNRKPTNELRRGWTTGACATAALKAALTGLWQGEVPGEVSILLPRGEQPVFAIARHDRNDHSASACVIKDAGDDPDVTHGASVCVRVEPSNGGVVFEAGEGVGTITKPGLPLAVGEPAINPVPRQMMTDVVNELARKFDQKPDVKITVSIPGGRELAAKTWNPRLGIKGGLSILGTTGIVRPFSCAAWIASIHRGVDVAVASGEKHVAGCTGATSEAAVQKLLQLPDHAMLDMGDFSGGLLKYLRTHPVDHLTIGGGIGKLTKLAQGAVDLHSGRSQVDFEALGAMVRGAGLKDVSHCGTALEALETAGPALAQLVAQAASGVAKNQVRNPSVGVSVIVVDRKGGIVARSEME